MVLIPFLLLICAVLSFHHHQHTPVQLLRQLISPRSTSTLCTLLLQTLSLSSPTRTNVRASSRSFQEAASILSKREISGWVSRSPSPTQRLLLPATITSSLFSSGLKPGDVTSSSCPLHDLASDEFFVIKVLDVKMQPMYKTFNANRNLKGGGAPGSIITRTSSSSSSSFTNSVYQLLSNGCQMNFSDSERIKGQLNAMGMVEFDSSTRNQPLTLSSSTRAAFVTTPSRSSTTRSAPSRKRSEAAKRMCSLPSRGAWRSKRARSC